MMRFLLMVTGLMCGLCLCCGCNEGGNSSNAPDTAAVSFTVEWIDEIPSGGVGETEERLTALLSDDCEGRGVATVSIRVNNSAGATLSEGTFPCSAKTGTLSGITPGSGYTIIVSGLNASGTTTYQGHKSGVTLNSGPNPVGTIQVTRFNNNNPVAVITSPANGATFQPGASVTFSGTGTDTEDGQLTDTYLVWTSSRDGEIGIGKSFSKSNLTTGTHTITLTVTDRDGATGNASINISIAESCSYSISPSNKSIGSSGGIGSVAVTTSSGCSWSASSNASWLSITSGSSGSGNGTVNYSISANTGTSSRTGTMTIAGNTFTVTQIGAISGSTFTNDLGMTLNYIPPGTFWMGSPEDEPGRDSEETRHQVTLTQGFYMQTTEVTQGQWTEVMGNNPSSFKSGDNYPVEMVSWNDIQGFIANMNLRGDGEYSLPTEAQWEYACRAGSTTAFANGGITVTDCTYDANLAAMGWYCYYSNNTTHPVAQKSSNVWGLYDMHGNVWEWCADWYESYPSSSVTDPTGPSTGDSRVVRGGSWSSYARYCRSAIRYLLTPDNRINNFGFRLVLLPGQ